MNLISKILSNSLKLGDENKFNFAFDFRELLNDGETEILNHISSLLWNKIKHLEPEVLVTKGYGGTPLLFGIKLAAYQDGHNLSTLQIRETRKTRGEFKKLVEGPVPEKLKGKRKTIFIDDLIQNGKTFYIELDKIIRSMCFNFKHFYR
jgi:adenine/guanine phosphoribosyltransferase-like PRPP-binding protein